jgi:oligoribonuclease NrnB/cAMP/cGMP phosphodiesterase (DHH superfamily)
MKFNYVIYHKNCLDGFSAFFLLHEAKKITRDALIYPDVPSAKNPPPHTLDKDILIVDVAYSYDVIQDILIKANSVTFIDHHITIHEGMKSLALKFSKLNLIYDENMSGSTLMWKYLYGSIRPPKFIRFIEDNDIGKWVMKDCINFITALRVKYSTKLNFKSLKKWSRLYKDSTINKLIELGKVYGEYKNFLAEDNSKRFTMERFPSEKIYEKYSQIFKKPGQYKVAVYCGTPCPTSLEISEFIFKNYSCDFMISWILNLEKKDYVLTFRSKHVDVGEIAAALGGGGHKLAASGVIKMKDFSIDELFYGDSLPRN